MVAVILTCSDPSLKIQAKIFNLKFQNCFAHAKIRRWDRRGVIDYDLSDGPVEKIFRRPYKFPVLFRTGANTLPLKILHFYFSALKIS